MIKGEPVDQINPYLTQVHAVLPRVLSMMDQDTLSHTFGVADRYRWAWKLIDFENGTYQGLAHGLARLLVADLLPPTLAEDRILQRIGALIEASEGIRSSNGSFVEAFPNESSFCVTALVVFDLLAAIELIEDRVAPSAKERWLEMIRPSVEFLQRADEHHAFISNHLATAAAALFRWAKVRGGDGQERAQLFLDRIINNQSSEGWFPEYSGADPGYQSLCTYYLADIHVCHPQLGLKEPLRRSIEFLSYFAHPDGSFGGLYGSRNTRFICPAGFEAVASEMPSAAQLSAFCRASIAEHRIVTLDAFDDTNLVPFFNAYCWAAAMYAENASRGSEDELPSRRGANPWRKVFREAGLVVDRDKNAYSIISTRKGGVIYRFDYENDNFTCNAGLAAKDRKGVTYTTQSLRGVEEVSVTIDEDVITVDAPLAEKRSETPTPFQFLLLRIACLTAFRSPAVGNWLKQMLVKRLITGMRISRTRNTRVIVLRPEFHLEDRFSANGTDLEPIETPAAFSAIHMASQGYWQMQDDAE